MIVKLLLESVIFLFVVFSIIGVNAMKKGKLGLSQAVISLPVGLKMNFDRPVLG